MKISAKKFLSLLMAFLLISAVLPLASFSAFAADQAEVVEKGVCSYNKDIQWTLDKNGVLTVTGTGKIPDLWVFGKNGLALSGSTNILTLLTDLKKMIDNYGTFEKYTEDVKTIIIGEGITSVGKGNFASCKNAAVLQLPSTLTAIGDSAFSYTAIEELTVPAAVKTIGEGAFYATKLKKVTFDKNAALQTIGKLAFAATALTTLDIPASVEKIGAGACSENEAFSGYRVNSDNKNYQTVNSVLYDKEKATLVCYPDALTATSFSIPGTVKTIQSAAFTNKKLESLTIPASVTKIEDGAFNCPALREIYNLSKLNIEAGASTFGGVAKYAAVVHTTEFAASGYYAVGDYQFVTDGKNHVLYDYIGSDTVLSLPTELEYNKMPVHSYKVADNAFAGSAVKAVDIPAEVKAIGASAFFGCKELESVSFAAGSKLTAIGASAFKNCAKLTVISLPEGVSSLGNSAFEGCAALEVFNLPASVKTIGNSAFAACKKLFCVNVPYNSALETIGKSAFAGNALEAFNLPETVVTIVEKAFENCTALKAVSVPASVKTLGAAAFSGCTALADVTFAYDSALTKIEKETFKKCEALTSVIVPKSVEEIGENAFADCSALETLYVCGKSCNVDSSKTTIPEKTVIYGYCVSSAHNYALLHRRSFESLDKLHLWSTATCTKPSACYVCGEVAAQPNNHAFSEWTVTLQPTCTEAGQQIRVCAVCGTEEIQVLPALGHSFSEWEYVTDAENGIAYKERICTTCGYKHAQSVAVIDADNAPEEPAVNYLIGDVNGDGKHTAADARRALRIAVKLDKATYVEYLAADVNADGTVTATDARKILRVASDLDTF